MLPEEYARINELAKLKKQRELTPAEQAERAALHKKYIGEMRESLRAQLESITILEEDGSTHKLNQKTSAIKQ